MSEKSEYNFIYDHRPLDQAVQITRNREGEIDQRLAKHLEKNPASVQAKLNTQPDAYILRSDEFTLLNYDGPRFDDDESLRRALQSSEADHKEPSKETQLEANETEKLSTTPEHTETNIGIVGTKSNAQPLQPTVEDDLSDDSDGIRLSSTVPRKNSKKRQSNVSTKRFKGADTEHRRHEPTSGEKRRLPKPEIFVNAEGQRASRPEAQRHPVINYRRRNDNKEYECRDPTCTSCGPNAMPVHRRRGSVTKAPYERSTRSEPYPYRPPQAPYEYNAQQRSSTGYVTGPAVVQPAQSRRRASVFAQPRSPVPHYGYSVDPWPEHPVPSLHDQYILPKHVPRPPAAPSYNDQAAPSSQSAHHIFHHSYSNALLLSRPQRPLRGTSKNDELRAVHNEEFSKGIRARRSSTINLSSSGRISNPSQQNLTRRQSLTRSSESQRRPEPSEYHMTKTPALHYGVEPPPPTRPVGMHDWGFSAREPAANKAEWRTSTDLPGDNSSADEKTGASKYFEDPMYRRARALPQVDEMRYDSHYPSSNDSDTIVGDRDGAVYQDLRFYVDNNSSLSLAFRGDMKRRTWQLVPAGNGMTDVVIGRADDVEPTKSKRRSNFSGAKARKLREIQARSSVERPVLRLTRRSQKDIVEFDNPPKENDFIYLRPKIVQEQHDERHQERHNLDSASTAATNDDNVRQDQEKQDVGSDRSSSIVQPNISPWHCRILGCEATFHGEDGKGQLAHRFLDAYIQQHLSGAEKGSVLDRKSTISQVRYSQLASTAGSKVPSTEDQSFSDLRAALVKELTLPLSPYSDEIREKAATVIIKIVLGRERQDTRRSSTLKGLADLADVASFGPQTRVKVERDSRLPESAIVSRQYKGAVIKDSNELILRFIQSKQDKDDSEDTTLAEEPQAGIEEYSVSPEAKTIPSTDRWAEIGKEAGERATRVGDELFHHSHRLNESPQSSKGESSGDRMIEDRVARIKARVAEKTHQKADHGGKAGMNEPQDSSPSAVSHGVVSTQGAKAESNRKSTTLNALQGYMFEDHSPRSEPNDQDDVVSAGNRALRIDHHAAVEPMLDTPNKAISVGHIRITNQRSVPGSEDQRNIVALNEAGPASEDSGESRLVPFVSNQAAKSSRILISQPGDDKYENLENWLMLVATSSNAEYDFLISDQTMLSSSTPSALHQNDFFMEHRPLEIPGFKLDSESQKHIWHLFSQQEGQKTVRGSDLSDDCIKGAELLLSSDKVEQSRDQIMKRRVARIEARSVFELTNNVGTEMFPSERRKNSTNDNAGDTEYCDTVQYISSSLEVLVSKTTSHITSPEPSPTSSRSASVISVFSEESLETRASNLSRQCSKSRFSAPLATSSSSASVISVFSVASLASSASDLSKASGYSATQIATATKVLISIFEEDEVLLPLYHFAIGSPAIGPDRLQRNLRRLFKAYAGLLADEANDQLEYLFPRLVSLKSRWLAQTIVAKFSIVEQDHPVPTPAVTLNREDESSDEETATHPVREDSFEDLMIFRAFLTGSHAFKTFRAQVQIFVLPKTTEPPNIKESVIKEVLADHSAWTTKSRKSENTARYWSRSWTNWQEDLMEYVDALLRQSYLARTPAVPLYLLSDLFFLATDMLLQSVGSLEPPLIQGKSRLRWRCGCGEQLMSDVTELRVGGAAELASRMEQHSGIKVTTSTYSLNTSNQQYVVPRPGRWLRNGYAKFTAAFAKSSKSQPCLPQHNTSCPSSTSTCSSTTIARPSMLHLLACMHHNRFRKVLHQDRIETVDTDRALLCFMRQQYQRHRGHLRRFISLKSVQGIFFIKFRLPLGGSVDVQHHDPCCVSAITQSGCECIPPKAKVEPSPTAEYRCVPGPPATYPPVPPEYLRSIFTCPNDVDEKDTWILNQLPRRTCGQLKGQIGQPADGWGIYYDEGFDGEVIAWFVAVIFVLASFLFAVLWWQLHFDMQGAFGASAYFASLCTIIISLMAMRASKAG